MAEKSRLSFEYPTELKNQLLILSKDDSRSLSSYIRNVLQKHVKDNTTDEIAERAITRAKKVSRRKNKQRKKKEN